MNADLLNYGMAKKTTPLPRKAPSKKDMVTTRFKTVIRPPQQFFREWRKYRGMTLEQAAGLAGMTAGNLSAMERGDQGFTPAGLQALANVYKTSPGWLLEVNPLEDGDGLMSTIARATNTQRKMIADIAKTIIGKTGTGG